MRQPLPPQMEKAVKALREGRFVILTDSEDRENEGDLVLAADRATPEAIAFMARKACGLICLSLPEEKIDKLDLPMMTQNNRSPRQTAFTVSIEASTGVDTGISAKDRARTIDVASRPDAKANDLISPGHVFPLRARKGTSLVRAGHTEGSLDLMTLAGLTPAAVICEVMNEDGTMSRMPVLQAFGEEHDIPLLTIEELIRYRVQTESFMQGGTWTELPTPYGDFKMRSYLNEWTQEEHVFLKMGDPTHESALTRIHSECLTGDALASLRCDCGAQLKESLRQISANGNGSVVYLKGQEGRGMGLANKLEAYALQDQGADTVEANLQLGHDSDARHYVAAAGILLSEGISKLNLLTNNPQKLTELRALGLTVQRSELHVPAQKHSKKYLKTKQEKMGHYRPAEKPPAPNALALRTVGELTSPAQKKELTDG